MLLLAVTAVFNFVLADTSANVNANGPVTAANYFAAYRSERTTTRNEELTQLDGVIALYQPGDAKYEEATKMKMEIVAAMEKAHRPFNQRVTNRKERVTYKKVCSTIDFSLFFLIIREKTWSQNFNIIFF